MSKWVLVEIYILFCNLLCFLCEEFRGHLKPLGHHRKPQGGVTILKQFPSPVDFYENYLARSQPFVVKGVLEQSNFPAYKLWTDKYLDKKYGSIPVDVEGGKKENREAQAYVMPMSKFLGIYNQSNIYMVYDVADEMKDDITIPVSLQCGGLQKAISSVIMWFSSGGTKSVLHNDGLDNINCLLDGNKDLIMFDKKYKGEIEADHFMQMGAYSLVDVEAVDMVKFPKLRNLPWYMVNITKGDCLFIPYRWYHHVYSHSGRNLAVNIWSRHLRWFNKTECETMEGKLKPKSLTIVNLDEESRENYEIREMFLSAFDEIDNITRNDFVTGLQKYTAKDFTEESLNKIFDIIDKDENKILTMQEMHECNYGDMLYQITNLESMFSADMEPPPNSYYNKEPINIDMDDDVSFLITSQKMEQDGKWPRMQDDKKLNAENMNLQGKEEL